MQKGLAEINEIIEICKKVVEYARMTTITRYNDGNRLYGEYKQLIRLFANKYNIEHHSSKTIRMLYDRIEKYYWNGQNYSVNEVEAENILNSIIELKHVLFKDYCDRIFISHCEKDKEDVHAFMDLLYAIGIEKPLQNGEKVVFCSSHPAGYIKNGKMFDEEIIKQFYWDYNTFFILWYTDGYFESQPCLNEAGAIWVMNKNYQEITSVDFDRSKIRGLLNDKKISFSANDVTRLNTFKEQIEEMFGINSVDINYWEKEREKYLKSLKHSL